MTGQSNTGYVSAGLSIGTIPIRVYNYAVHLKWHCCTLRVAHGAVILPSVPVNTSDINNSPKHQQVDAYSYSICHLCLVN